MANKNINARVALKNDFEANWIIAGNNNFIPLKGEEILYNAETDDSPLPIGRTYRIPYNRRKIGDGKRNVNELPFEAEEQFIEIESPDVFVFNYTTKTWNIDPTGPFILTKSFDGTQLPGGDSFMHSCTYYKGDIVRHEIIGSPDMAANDGAPYHIKQTIQHATMPMEHYRYWRDRAGWTGWNYTVHGPKPRLNGGCPNNIVSLGINYDDPMGGFVELVYTEADKIVTNYGDNHYVSYDKETTLTEAQKIQARENIGAGRTTLVVNDEEIEIYTPIGTQGSATGAEIFNDYYSNQATGEYSHAEGLSTEASGARSHAEGDTTHATAMASHAEGADTHAEGTASHAEGYGTRATGDYSHAEGYTSEASGYYSHAEGYHTVASDSYAHAEGEETTASGYDSHAEGYDSEASGQASHAEGYYTSAEGDYSHAENYFTTASSDYAHAEGYLTTASGDASHAEGASTVASGTEAHAEGWQTVASGRESHAEGEGTIANSYAQHAQGKYNIEDAEDTYAHIVGNGVDNENRSNAHTLDWEGNAWFARDVYVGSTSGTNKDSGSKRLARIDEVVGIEILETPKDGEILVYDAAINKLINSGYTIDTLKQWVRDYVETYMSTEITIDDNGNQILSVTGKEIVIDNPDGSQTLIIGG